MHGPVLLLGINGAGKTTAGSYLSDRFGSVHISAGAILRRARDQEGRRSADIAARIDAGQEVPLEISYGLLKEELSTVQGDQLVTLDGYPATIDQINLLMSAFGAAPHLAIHLDLPREIAVHRIQQRAICSTCDRTYGPEGPGGKVRTCRNCGSVLQRRPDDVDPSALAKRLDRWATRGAILVEHYEDVGILEVIDASTPWPDVQEQLQTIWARKMP